MKSTSPQQSPKRTAWDLKKEKQLVKKIKIKKPQKKTQHPTNVSGAVTTKPVQVVANVNAADANELDDLIGSSTDALANSREFMSPASSVRKKRGRPTKEEAQAKAEAEPETTPPPSFDSKPACDMLFTVASGWMVRKIQDKRVGLLPEEIDNLGTAWGKVLDKYVPAALEAYGEEFAAILVTGTVAARLYMVTSQIIAEKQKERENTFRATGTAVVQPQQAENQA